MKHRILSFALSLLAVLFANGVFADTWDGTASIWNHGNGTASSPFLIESSSHLAYLAGVVNGGVETYEGVYFKMVTNIDLGSLSWSGIGTSETVSFKGVFDGNNFTISGINSNTALFNYINNACIMNLSTSGSSKCAGVVVFSYGDFTVISNCHSSVTVTGGTGHAGGILSCINGGKVTISNCSNSGSVTVIKTDKAAGGIVGMAENDCSIINCYNVGVITNNVSLSPTDQQGYSVYSYAGGIVGVIKKNCTILKCYNAGDIVANADLSHTSTSSGLHEKNRSCAGGIVGFIQNASCGRTIELCYNKAMNTATSTTYGKYQGSNIWLICSLLRSICQWWRYCCIGGGRR